MMNILLQNVSRVADPAQSFDIRIVDGKIAEVGKELAVGASQSLALEGKQVTEGWCELFSNFADPGFEYREDLQSGAQVAAAGGFTDICLLPNTSPVVDSKADVEYLKAKGALLPVSVHPTAALSAGIKGESIAELYDLWHAGAIYFSDGTSPVWNAELLLKALQYAQRFDGLVVVTCLDRDLSRHGQMHEGPVSTSLGLKGLPTIAEVVALRRDLELLKYAGGRLHVSGVSSASAVDLIAEAKREGLRITCDVPLNNLVYSDEDMPPFDTAYKIQPPLRGVEDRAALRKGLEEGTIDAISCRHMPRDQEEKELEFDLAEFGAIALQTAYNSLRQLSSELDLSLLMDRLSAGPREVLGLEPVSIAVGADAKLTVIDPGEIWTYDQRTNLSKSANSPLLGQELHGRVLGIVNGSSTYLPGYL